MSGSGATTGGAPLIGSVVLRPARLGDGAALAAAYRRNRDHLAPWEPVREAAYFTPAGQERDVAAKLDDARAGCAMAFVLEDGEDIVGRLTVTGIVRGPFLSGDLGYWVDGARTGQGIATAAVEKVARRCAADGLHRLQAATLPQNAASQAVLAKAGFTRIGLAPRYLRIAGRWQDHVLFQRLLGE